MLRKANSRRWALFLLALCLGVVGAARGDVTSEEERKKLIAQLAKRYPPKVEQEFGKRIAQEIDKQFGVVDDPEQLARVQRIVNEIAAVSDRPDVKYDVKILNVEVPNAFAISGGYVRVTKGLLRFCQSEHELAGVLAHELAHNCLYHPLRQRDKDRSVQKGQWLALLAALLFNVRAEDVFSLMTIVQLVRANIMAGYSRPMEMEADAVGLEYLSRTKYDPTGFLTVMERFAELARQYYQPPPQLRAWDTHPPSAERCREIVNLMKAKGLPINRAKVLRGFKAFAEQVEVAEGLRVWQVRLGDYVVYQAGPEPVNGKTPEQRMREACDAINNIALARGLGTFAIGGWSKTFEEKGLYTETNREIQLYGQPVLHIAKTDAQLAGMSLPEFHRAVFENFRATLARLEAEGRNPN